ncbi:MAG: flagellar protein FlgN [Chlorobi bacterium]|nr:flagellar protein FlgN [Chlorobiota bacterium]
MDCQELIPWYRQVVNLLQQESAAIETMLLLSQQLQESLIRFDAAAIEQIARRQEQQLEHLFSLERQRWNLVSEGLAISQDQARALTMTELLKYLPPDCSESVHAIGERLRGCLADLHLANSINRMLALRGRNSIQATLSFVRERNLHAVDTSL